MLERLPVSDGALAGHPDLLPQPARTSLVRCLVTQVDGMGRGSIGISVSQRESAANRRVSVRRSIRVLRRAGRSRARVGHRRRPARRAGGAGRVGLRPRCPRAGPGAPLGKLDDLRECGSCPRCASGSTSCSGRSFKPRALPATIAGIDPSSIPAAEMAARVRDLLEECPSWLDLSPLTFQLAEEIRLREGSPTLTPAAMPASTASSSSTGSSIGSNSTGGCSCGWPGSGNARDSTDLSTSALACASELSDEQYAVPSHPFTVELTTRSLVLPALSRERLTIGRGARGVGTSASTLAARWAAVRGPEPA